MVVATSWQLGRQIANLKRTATTTIVAVTLYDQGVN